LLKKIAIVGGITLIVLVLVGLIISNYSVDESTDEMELDVKGDVIMPSKVSRPGCEVVDRCYIPSSIVIESGKEITWINEDSAFHSVTSGFYDAPTNLFDSGHLDPFESYTLAFDRKGTFDYFCTLHPWMMGQVIVE
jgi:plastocyanin